jgi:putative ABC transport system permease protein
VAASVVAWIGSTRWLEQFAYRIQIGPGPFLAATGIVLGVAVVTIAWQSLKAAWLNPVDAIGRE